MVGIRSPDGLVVGSRTSHPGVLGSIPKREEPGKTGAPCVKVPGSSRVPVAEELSRTRGNQSGRVDNLNVCLSHCPMWKGSSQERGEGAFVAGSRAR